MHEIGHNLGLAHSGEGTAEYGDQSGFVGVSWNKDDWPKMCFNAPKSWQLGWYADKAVTTVPPLFSTWTRRLMGIADYDHYTTTTVLVKLETGRDLDYYINFNRKKGINSQTQEGSDQVLISSQGGNGTPIQLMQILPFRLKLERSLSMAVVLTLMTASIFGRMIHSSSIQELARTPRVLHRLRNL